MVLTCIWTTPSGDSLFNDPLWHIRCRERASSTTSKAAVAAGLPDVGLPPDSGGMAKPWLRATKRHSALVPVIAVTAHTMVARLAQSAARAPAWPPHRR